MKFELPLITRSRLKIIDADSKTIGDGSTSDPTEEEKAWMDIMSSTAPELETRKKKLSVCAFADVVEYNHSMVKFMYDDVQYVVKKPTNSLQIARARERSLTDAVEALVSQFCVCAGAVPVAKDFSNVPVEVIRIVSNVAENFFFAPYL